MFDTGLLSFFALYKICQLTDLARSIYSTATQFLWLCSRYEKTTPNVLHIIGIPSLVLYTIVECDSIGLALAMGGLRAQETGEG